MDPQPHDFVYAVSKTKTGSFVCRVGSFPHLLGHGETPVSSLEDAIHKVEQELAWWKEQFEPAPLPTCISPVSRVAPVNHRGIVGWMRATTDHDHFGAHYHPYFEDKEPFGDPSAYRTLTHFGARIFTNVRGIISLACHDIIFEIKHPWEKPMKIPAGLLAATGFSEDLAETIEAKGRPYHDIPPQSEIDVLQHDGDGGYSVSGFIRLPEPITYPPDSFDRIESIATYTQARPLSESPFFLALEKLRECWAHMATPTEQFTVEIFLYGRQLRRP